MRLEKKHRQLIQRTLLSNKLKLLWKLLKRPRKELRRKLKLPKKRLKDKPLLRKQLIRLKLPQEMPRSRVVENFGQLTCHRNTLKATLD